LQFLLLHLWVLKYVLLLLPRCQGRQMAGPWSCQRKNSGWTHRRVFNRIDLLKQKLDFIEAEVIIKWKYTPKGNLRQAAWPSSQVHWALRSSALLWTGFNDYPKDIYILWSFSMKQEGISKNWGMANSLSSNVSSEPRRWFEARCMHEIVMILRCKEHLWLTSRVWRVPVGSLLEITGHCIKSLNQSQPLLQDRMKQDIWQNVPDLGQVPVAHTCNPSYSGGRDQEDLGSKPAQANSPWDPISKKKKKSQKRTGGVAQGIGPDFKSQYWKKKCTWYSAAPVPWLLYAITSFLPAYPYQAGPVLMRNTMQFYLWILNTEAVRFWRPSLTGTLDSATWRPVEHYKRII
jgi:hypothetical protein